jgi:hypothetical protein
MRLVPEKPSLWNRGARLIALCVVFAFCHQARAQTVPVSFTGGGTTAFDGWVNMNNFNPDFDEWPTAPAESNAPGSGDAQLELVDGTGTPFFATESLYFLSYQQVANALGGTLFISDPTPVAGVKSIALQVEIGEALGYGFQSPGGYPVLKVNGQPATYAPAYAVLLNRYQNGTYDSPETGEEPVYVKTLGYQWNLEGVGTVHSIEIEFSAVTHAQIYEIRLDQTDVPQSGAAFVPGFLALAGIGTPQYDGSSTSVTHSFVGPSSRTLTVEYSELVGQGPWTASTPVETGPGSFDVTFTAPGDHRTAWSRNMFFRARYPADP